MGGVSRAISAVAPAFLLGLCAALCGCAAMSAPRSYPAIDPKSSSDVIVVANIRAGGYFPEFPECGKPDVICLDPPPFWFRADVRETLFGSVDRESIVTATTSHYGMESLASERGPLLLRLSSDGKAFVTPRYALAALTRDRTGELFLVLRSGDPVWWLPCSAMGLAVRIDPAEFEEDLLIPDGHLTDEEIARNPQFLERTQAGVLPRMALPVTALSEHLRREYRTARLPDCRDGAA